MIKFKEQDGKLFRILDKPVPLRENDENVLVRFIKHGVIGEYVREHWLDCNQKNVPIYIDDVDSDGDVTIWIDEKRNEHHCCPFPMFEIIGTLVKEGSEEWGEYQTQQGVVVRHKDGCVVRPEYDSPSRAAIFEHYPTGWQIYEEPKPLLADTGIGDIVKTNLGDWLQIVDTPCLRFGHDECHRTHDGLYWDENGVCAVDSTYRLVAVEPLAPEGTAEWAWQMAKLGEETRCYEGKIRVAKSGRIEVCYNGMAYAMPLTQSAENSQYAINKIRECSPDGWQIHEEPKEEPPKEPDNLYLNIKPSNPADWCFDKKNLLVLVDDNFKGIVGENVTREQVGEIAKLLTDPATQYKVGDWVEVKETATGEIEHHTVERINTFCPVSPEYLVDDVWFNHDGMEIIPLEFMFNHRRITRKLSPSEVVIPVNISGTVRQAYNEDGTINDEQFQLLPNGSWDGTEMFISFDALDTQTRKLVEGLLRAQKIKKTNAQEEE